MRRMLILLGFVPLSLYPTLTRADVLLGTNYGWYGVDNPPTPQSGANPFANYDAVQNYDTQTALINSQLLAMRSAGQTTISIPLYPADGLDFGSVLDSTGGNFNTHDLNNLINFVAEVKTLGFSSILYRFNFLASNSWGAPPSVQAINSELIANLTNEVFAQAGIPYLVDLTGEGIAEPGYMNASDLSYDQNLWQAYITQFGIANTVGFSTNHLWDQAGVNELEAVYQGVYPSEFAFEFYDVSGVSIYDQFVDLYNELNAAGINRPWIIPESYYDDPETASELEAAIGFTHQDVTALYQWQLTSPPNSENVIPPIQIAAYNLLNADSVSIPEPNTAILTIPALLGIFVLGRRRAPRKSCLASGRSNQHIESG